MTAYAPQQAAYTRTVEYAQQATISEAVLCQSPQRAEWAPVMRELLGLRSLRNDWDGEGSDAPSCEVVATAMKLAVFLRDNGQARPDSAFASRAGTVIFAWREGKRYQEIEATGPEQYEWMVIDETGVPTHGEFSLPMSRQEAQYSVSPSTRSKLSA